MNVSLDKVSIIKGGLGNIYVTCDGVSQYTQLQIEIYDTCSNNPSSKLGYGAQLNCIEDNKYQTTVDTKNLDYGIYELKLVRFHTPNDLPNDVANMDFVGGRDFDRLFFEVIPAIQLPNTDNLRAAVTSREKQLENDFLKGINLQDNSDTEHTEYCVFVFVKGILIGQRSRFDRYEILPFRRGIDTKDSLECVNDFLNMETSTKVTFMYEDDLQKQSRHDNPVCVVHFPNIIASEFETAKAYCENKSQYLIKALSLTRDASGEIFDVVVYNRKSSASMRYTARKPYIGNLLTGSLSGEHAETIERYATNLEVNPFNDFLVNLYKEAKQERNPEFQYVRLWNILEILAESKNYNPDNPLVDYEGIELQDDGNTRKVKGSVNIVYNLFRKSEIGSSNETWKNINIWFAFRNSVAHHGSISNYKKLSRNRVRQWAAEGVQILQSSNEHDTILWNLKEDVKILLRKELSSN